MTLVTIRRYAGNPYLIAALIWVIAWLILLPSSAWITAEPWIRLIVAAWMFLIPGCTVSILLMETRIGPLGHVLGGVAISIFIVGALSAVARFFHLPFTFIKTAFAASGLIGFVLLAALSVGMADLFRSRPIPIASFVVLLFLMTIAVGTAWGGRMPLDNIRYLAYLTTWQHSPALNFRDVFFGLPDVGQVRYWLAVFPMDEALLADMTGLHGLLLLGFYLEPMLVVLGILAAYYLYAVLFPSRLQAMAATLIHIMVLVLLKRSPQPGSFFFWNLNQDKAFAAFILWPIFFVATRHFLTSPTRRSALYLLMCGLSITFTHPIFLAYTVFIAGLSGVISLLVRKEYRLLLVFSVLLAVIILPAASLRLVGIPWVNQHIFGVSSALNNPAVFDYESASESRGIDLLVSHMDGTPFYGFNPTRLQFFYNDVPTNGFLAFLTWSFLWVTILGFVWALFNFRKNDLAPLVAAASLLVLLGIIPYTGWLVGFFVSARMLWRIPWLYPIGLVSMLLITETWKFLMGGIRVLQPSGLRIERGIWLAIVLICLAVIAGRSLRRGANGIASLFPNRTPYLTRLEGLASLGDYLERELARPAIFVAPSDLMSYLPGLSSKSKVVFFRDPKYSIYTVNPKQVAELLLPVEPPAFLQRAKNLTRYDVQYILTKDPALVTYYLQDSHFVSNRTFGPYRIIEFLPSDP